MPDKFCGHCGSPIDNSTGLCPMCSQELLNPVSKKEEDVSNNNLINKNSASKILITVLLSISLFITSLVATLIFDVRNSVKPNNAQALLNNINATELFSYAELSAENDLENFYKYMSENYDVEMTDRGLNSFVNDSTAKDFLAEKVSYFCEDIIDGDAEIKITKNEVSELIENNLEEFEDEFDVQLSSYDAEQIATWIFGTQTSYSVDSTAILEETPAIYYIFTIGFSYVTMVALILLSIVIIFFMIKNNLLRAFRAIAIVYISLGGLLSLIAMLSAWIAPLWKIICADSFVGILAGNIFSQNALLSILILVFGVAVVVSRSLLIKYRKKST